MTGDIEELVRRIVDQQMSRQPKKHAAEVTSYDPKRHAVKAKAQPSGVESGWMPIATSHIGDGIGVAIGPNIGDQIIVDYLNGDIDSPFMAGRLHSDKEQPPQANSGEMVLQTAGAKIATSGGSVSISAGGGTLELAGGSLKHNGVEIGSTHKHGGVTIGAGQTDVPV